MTAPTATERRRRETREHYDRHPFGFDQEEILEEKLHHRVMGEAILELAGSGATVLDVGCGACRVAKLVRRVSDATTIGVDLSIESLRSVRADEPGPLVNGDNLQMPFRDGLADLVVSNGVIHHTPDAHRSFLELARLTRPGGTLVVSVYDRNGWYFWVWHTLGAAIRGLRRLIGDAGLKVTVFPFFHLSVLLLLSVATRRWFRVPVETSWNLFHDQFTTPQCTFHTFDELRSWAEEAGLDCDEQRREAANQLATVRLRKRAEA